MGRICECHSYGKCNGDVLQWIFLLGFAALAWAGCKLSKV